jgi:hypothetical protein
MEAKGRLMHRVDRLGRREQRAGTAVLVHGAATPAGRCPDCPLQAGAHFTISIDRVEQRDGDDA